MSKFVLDPIPLCDLAPEFAAFLENTLIDLDFPVLAATVTTMKVFGRCSCGDDDCASIYTSKMESLDPGERVSSILTSSRPSNKGMMIISTVNDERIDEIEIFDRRDLRRILAKSFP